VHVVFQYLEPHGDKYAYISKWLARTMARSTNDFLPARCRSYFPYTPIKFDYVPFSVDIPEPTHKIRSSLGIPEEGKVALRFGGLDTFDISWVKRVLLECLDEDPNLWFLGVNTQRFTNHPRAIFAPTILGLQAKANMLHSADFVIHARRQGESFGMNLLESMQASKPILSWIGGWDRNHTTMLHPSSYYYSPIDLKWKIKNYAASCNVVKNRETAEKFRPDSVLPLFREIFSNGVL
jgi:glycosyltransferase involved in cell wall biosynthesis